METLHTIACEAADQIPPQRVLRDQDRDVIRRHRDWLLTLGPDVAEAFGDVLYSRLPEGAGASRESLENWWGRTVNGPWDDDYLAWMALVGLVHVTRRITNPMMLAASDHVVQLVADAAVLSGIPDDDRRALLDAVGRVAGIVRVVIAWSHERAVSAALYEAAGMPEGLLARLRDQEVGAFLERARAELNL
ncbi:protoglobin domain-containing protein [[Pseudopropionibacterium] massiliense]|uniref:protoglobin domain-containing protein n=1 Tax=[Pseudopropionibacterium] massiliense TaxID=2220000 RepID=UPI0010319959|nr:protoglobin domain-containing protein [[Pseudopropionibacterium] massiliense]